MQSDWRSRIAVRGVIAFQGASLSSPEEAVVKKCQVALLNEAFYLTFAPSLVLRKVIAGKIQPIKTHRGKHQFLLQCKDKLLKI